jgi:Mn-dependent DtxR family transcriptional regulator
MSCFTEEELRLLRLSDAAEDHAEHTREHNGNRSAAGRPMTTSLRVYDAIGKNGSRVRDIAKILGVSCDVVSVSLKRLRDRCLVTKDKWIWRRIDNTASACKPCVADVVIDHMRKTQQQRPCEIARCAGLQTQTVYYALRLLLASGTVERASYGHYRLARNA